MHSLQKEINELKSAFETQLNSVKTSEDLEALRIAFLSRQGRLAGIMSTLKGLSVEDKKVYGPLLNTLKNDLNSCFETKKAALAQEALQAALDKDKDFDVTAYQPQQLRGSLHPLSLVERDVENIFISMGFTKVEGPEVETEEYNFEALNIPSHHPARDMWDTFFLTLPNLLLRTHTSSVQIHTLKTHKLPLAVFAPGRAYRHEATDATHDFMFNQVEGLVIDKNISLANLLATAEEFFKALFNDDSLRARVRPSYFPFVEPGVEIDITNPFSKSKDPNAVTWLEIGGAGLVHPNVLHYAGINPEEYSGFAFGFGLDRIAMLQYGIPDIRLLTSGKVDFLEQF